MNSVDLMFAAEVEESAVEEDRLVQVESSGSQEPEKSSVADDIGVLRHRSEVVPQLVAHQLKLPLLLSAPSVVHREDRVSVAGFRKLIDRSAVYRYLWVLISKCARQR